MQYRILFCVLLYSMMHSDFKKKKFYLFFPFPLPILLANFFYVTGANNLIPIEIALKIANKIKANERFSAYIVVPMWPEGNPTGAATQRILYWQVRLNSSFISRVLFLVSCR